jgi:hypothetical protein
MTAYQFFMVKDFPAFTRARKEISNQVQMTITGAPETIHTKITPLQTALIEKFEPLRIETGIKYEVFGYTYIPINGKLEKKDFSEYVRTVEFPAYLNRDLRVIILKANHKVAAGFLKNIRSANTGISLLNTQIDFNKVHELFPRYIAAWFKNLSPNLKSGALSGINIENTVQFKQFLKLGEISALGMDFSYEGQSQPFILGKHSAVSLYKPNKSGLVHEAKLIIRIFEQFVSKTWVERNKASKDVSTPSVIDPEFHHDDPKFLDDEKS